MSKRISGGLVVNKRKSNVVSPKKTKGGSQYSSYLKFQKGGDSCQGEVSSQGTGHDGSQGGGGSRKITIGRRRGGGKIKPCKNRNNKKKDLPGEIPILDVQFVKKEDKDKIDKKEEVKKEEVKKGEVKKEDKRRSSQKRVSRVNRVSRVSRANKVGGGNKVSRSNRVRRVSRVNRANRANKGSNKKEKKGRKVSVTTTRKLGKKET